MPAASPEEIEVKYAVRPESSVAALAALKLDGTKPDKIRTVHFFDTPATALFGLGLILRARQTLTGGDTTLKVRGPNAPAAAERFLGSATGERKYEGDMNVGQDEKPSFSLTLDQVPADIAAVLAPKIPLTRIFSKEAETLLGEAGINWGDLRAFSPIHARVWKTNLDDFNGKVTVEIWKAGDKDLLEVSDKVARDQATDFADRLASFLTKKGLLQLNESKTLFALRQLQPPKPLHP